MVHCYGIARRFAQTVTLINGSSINHHINSVLDMDVRLPFYSFAASSGGAKQVESGLKQLAGGSLSIASKMPLPSHHSQHHRIGVFWGREYGQSPGFAPAIPVSSSALIHFLPQHTSYAITSGLGKGVAYIWLCLRFIQISWDPGGHYNQA